VRLAEELGLHSLAFPLIGAGSGGFAPDRAEEIMLEVLQGMDSALAVTVVRFQPSGQAPSRQ